MNTQRTALLLAAVFGFTGVALGAFAAHGLKEILTPELLVIFETGARYQMVHALALLGVAALPGVVRGRLGITVVVCFAVGIVIFSGSLYALALTDIRRLGAITPIGGVAFLIGWAGLLVAALQKQPAKRDRQDAETPRRQEEKN